MSYDLNQTQLNSLLNDKVSNTTHNLINAALLDSGYFPTRGLQLPTAAENDHVGMADTVSLNLGVGNAEFGESIGLYVETGSNVTLDIDTPSPWGSVIAAGDGANVVLRDDAGGDTLVGGAGHDTLTGGDDSYLMAGSGPTDMNDTAGDDTFVGGTGDDKIHSSGDFDTIYGGSGAETINISGSGSALYAGTGFESITMSGSHDSIYLGQGSGAPATDTINVTGMSDSIYVGTAGGVDSINAGADSLDLYIASSKSPTSTYVHQTDPTDHIWQISYQSGSTTTNITVEGSDVLLHFDDGGSKTI